MKTPMQRLIDIHNALPPHQFYAYFNEMKEMFELVETNIIVDAFWGGKDGHSQTGIDYFNKIHSNEKNK